MGGYLATDEQWEGFETDWQKALDANGVTALHMKHFAHSRGEFKDWKGDEPRRARFLERLASVIHKHDLEGFTFSLNMRHYREMDKRFSLTESVGPYAYIALQAMSQLRVWQRRYRPNDSLLYVFEHGDADQGRLRRWLDKDDSLFPKPAFIKKRWVENGVERACLPLQAGDFLAYEGAKALTDWMKTGKQIGRESLHKLSWVGKVDRQPLNSYYQAEQLIVFIKGFRIRQR
jgi:hypothetical protein